MFSLNRLSALLIIVTLGLVSFFALPWPTRLITIGGHELDISGKTLVAGAVLGLIATGAQALAGAKRPKDPCYIPSLTTFWIGPTLVSAVALAVLDRPNPVSTRLMVCSATVAVLAAVMIAEHCTTDPNSRLRIVLRTAVGIAAFSLVALLMAALRMRQMSVVLLGTVAGVCGGAVTYLVLSAALPNPRRALICASASGLAVGIVGHAIVPVVAEPGAYGLVLTTTLYASTGLLRGYLRRDLRRTVVIEYLLVAAIGLLIVIVFGR